MNNIKVCITCDNNYIKYAGVTIASILDNASIDDKLTFYIVSNDLTEENKQKVLNLKKINQCEIKFIEPSEEIFSDFANTKTTDYLPIASFYRLKLPSLLQNEDKVIYLDCDTIVNTSLAPMFNTNIDDFYCAAIKDIGFKRLGKRIGLSKNQSYINSGVLLINLKKWRVCNAESQLVKYASENPDKIFLGDQDLINKCFADEILLLDGKWNLQVVNFCSRSDYSSKFNILHYTGGSKPWKMGSYMPLKKYYFKYLTMTDWENPNKFWHIQSNLLGAFLYIKHRPLFMFRPGFFKSIFYMITNL